MSRWMMMWALAGMAGAAEAQVDVALEKLGMENIRSVREADGSTVTAFEDRLFRSSYEGVGKAIESVLEAQTEGEARLVVLDDNGIPQLRIVLPEEAVKKFSAREWDLRQVIVNMKLDTETDRELKVLKGEKTRNRSSWKPDLVVYPQLFLENTSLDKLYRYAVSLAPAVEMPLWKGAELTAQVILPITTNQQGQLRQVRPGIVAVNQHFYLGKNWRMTVAGGQFTGDRLGGIVEAGWRSRNGLWNAEAEAGLTVFSFFDQEGWYLTRKPKLNLALRGAYYIRPWSSIVSLEAAQYVYGDRGVKGDFTRMFGEYSIGVYGMWVDGEINGGFHFTVPLPGKKYKRWKGMRVKPADYFGYTYSVSYVNYMEKKMGYTYKGKTDRKEQQYVYSPEYVRYFLLKNLDKHK